ncbi:PREDICTED: chymotrypsin inhibitor-like [Habropoda laboriosa]|uniref:chymotrypsin inhibitor-like n=1 Tax=Habropoda laboriosa TaxID=597456 RepID=UPI00083DB9F6|nr:PREDICTED: chymotrypsin inhibitor-like [Habropoda laboriosa]
MAFLGVLAGEARSTAVPCQENAEWTNCGSMCPPMCNSTTSTVCPQVCVPRCQCIEGYVLTIDGACVLSSEC